MPLAAGTRIGGYEVLSALGAGGMGEVYRARDTQLNRSVAIKVLPELFAVDAERLARFTREAQTLGALNHPNIAHIYGLESAAGSTRALVMELVEGEDLSVMIARGPVPLDEALPYARQLADALEAAHDLGIVHRDLKPANIKVRPDGTVKVLDFGLAKAVDPTAASADDAMRSPTLTARATQMGTIIGTAAYMAPEQAKGKAVDKRADIWAFGVVLYEMLTGRRAFGGDDISEVLAAVLRQEIDWTPLPANTPLRLRRLLERCLERDPKTRLRDIGEARVELASVEAGAPDGMRADAPGAPRRRAWRETLAWSVAAGASLVAIALVYGRQTPAATPDRRIVRLPFVAPANVEAAELGNTLVSPDGQKLLFSARSPDGRRLLWVRPLDGMTAEPLPDTEDAIEPFWSPDSRTVGFGAQGKLKRIDLGAARAQTLTDAARLVGGAWGRSGVIVFGPDFRSPLYKVAATGGPREPATRLDQSREDTGHRYPFFLPDGRHFLYASFSNQGGAALIGASIDSSEVTQLLPDSAPAIYVAPGRLLYARNGTVVTHAFDANRLTLEGEPSPIEGGALPGLWPTGGRFSVSDNGVLVLQSPPTFDYQLAWFDRAGNRVGAVGPAISVGVASFPRISPDGKRVVVQRFDRQALNQDLWIGDLARGTFDRFTTNPALEQLAFWTPDGRSVIFTTARQGASGIHQLSTSGGGERLLLKGTVFPGDISPDGKRLFYMQRGPTTRSDIWTLPLAVDTPANGAAAPSPLLDSEFDEQAPHISPDGRWITYMSDVSGTPEVYVRRLTADGKVGEARRVSSGGGVQPRWSRDGRELFYVSAPQGYLRAQMMAASVRPAGESFEFNPATPLFKVPMLPIQSVIRDYDLSLDGQRFLVGTTVNAAGSTSVTIVLNWLAGVTK